jgi:hypothetical protein
MSGCKAVKEIDRQTGRKTAKLNNYGALSENNSQAVYAPVHQCTSNWGQKAISVSNRTTYTSLK